MLAKTLLAIASLGFATAAPLVERQWLTRPSDGAGLVCVDGVHNSACLNISHEWFTDKDDLVKAIKETATSVANSKRSTDAADTPKQLKLNPIKICKQDDCVDIPAVSGSVDDIVAAVEKAVAPLHKRQWLQRPSDGAGLVCVDGVHNSACLNISHEW